jgi:hypothetical protein
VFLSSWYGWLGEKSSPESVAAQQAAFFDEGVHIEKYVAKDCLREQQFGFRF